MKKANLIASLILLALSGFFVVEALKMPLFEMASPGPGFVPLGTGVLIMILSFSLLVKSLRIAPQKTRIPFMEKKHGLKDILKITISLFAYCAFILLIGYPMATFLFLFFLLKVVGKYSYKFSLGTSVVATAALQGIFNYWLEMAFPVGVLTHL